MPLLLTPAQPLTAATGAPIASTYAIILHVSYDTREKSISFRVGYFFDEAAYVAKCTQLESNALPTYFEHAATPSEANAVPIFQFLEQALTQQLTSLLGPDTTIENVP